MSSTFSFNMAVVAGSLSHNKPTVNENIESIFPLQFILSYLTEEFRVLISSS